MQIVEFDLTKYNYLIVDQQAYFVLQKRAHEYYLVPDGCPHRGGPLHLGEFCNESQKITCPWHQNSISWQRLCSKALPTIRINNTLKIFLRKQENNIFLLNKSSLPLKQGDTHANI